MRGINLLEFKLCPKFIISPSHWYPVHKVEECGANEIIKENDIEIHQENKPLNIKKSMFYDVEKICEGKGCGKAFVWTVGEQKFIQKLYESGKVNSIFEPKRCLDCRQKKKALLERKSVKET